MIPSKYCENSEGIFYKQHEYQDIDKKLMKMILKQNNVKIVYAKKCRLCNMFKMKMKKLSNNNI